MVLWSLAILASGLLPPGEQPVPAAAPKVGQRRAIALVKKRGGSFKIDRKHPEQPIIEIDLSGTQVTNEELESLEGLIGLHRLNLFNIKVTDAGLRPLRGLILLCQVA